jgi:hypothetical protein
MCLTYSKYHTNKLHREFKTKSKIVVYKYLKKNNKNLWSIIYPRSWKIGENISNRCGSQLQENEIAIGCVNYGFHVFLNYKSAVMCANMMRTNMDEVIIKFTAKTEDFVAASKPHPEITDDNKKVIVQEAVFSKLTLQKSTWEKLFIK